MKHNEIVITSILLKAPITRHISLSIEFFNWSGQTLTRVAMQAMLYIMYSNFQIYPILPTNFALFVECQIFSYNQNPTKAY